MIRSKLLPSLAFLTIILLSACGISTSKQEDLRIGLQNSLDEMFLSQDAFTAFSPEVKLTNVEKGGAFKYKDAAYHGNFSCIFEDMKEGIPVVLNGVAIMDENGQVVKGDDGKCGIYIMLITENRKRVDRKSSIYNLKQFN